ncbi:MAG: hypothetical protein ACFB22_12920 [Rhodothalassiaceae bacterium]
MSSGITGHRLTMRKGQGNGMIVARAIASIIMMGVLHLFVIPRAASQEFDAAVLGPREPADLCYYHRCFCVRFSVPKYLLSVWDNVCKLKGAERSRIYLDVDIRTLNPTHQERQKGKRSADIWDSVLHIWTNSRHIGEYSAMIN